MLGGEGVEGDVERRWGVGGWGWGGKWKRRGSHVRAANVRIFTLCARSPPEHLLVVLPQ